MTNEATAVTRWRAVASLGLGAFAIVAAEFLPVGMLADVARDMHVTLGTASAIVLVPGLVAGVSAPLVVTLIRSWDRRLLVLSLTALLVVSDIVTWSALGRRRAVTPERRTPPVHQRMLRDRPVTRLPSVVTARCRS